MISDEWLIALHRFFFLLFCLFPFPQLLNCLYLNQQDFMLFLFLFSPTSFFLGGGGEGWVPWFKTLISNGAILKLHSTSCWQDDQHMYSAGFGDLKNILGLKSLQPEVELKTLLWPTKQTTMVKKFRHLNYSDMLFLLMSSKTAACFHWFYKRIKHFLFQFILELNLVIGCMLFMLSARGKQVVERCWGSYCFNQRILNSSGNRSLYS